MTKLGRNWYQIKWVLTDSNEDNPSREQWVEIREMPVIIDVLAKSPEQAKSIAKECHPGLGHVKTILVYMRGTERQFQQQEEPEGEENLDLLPW